MSYVIKYWDVQEIDGLDDDLVTIKGRASGIGSWILSMIGVEATTSLRVTRDRFIFEESSWSGRRRISVDLEHITTTFYGFSKPWKTAVLVGMVTATFTAGLGLLLTPLIYWYQKSLVLGVSVSGQPPFIMEFQPSILAGESIDETEAERAADLILDLISMNKRRRRNG